MAVRVAGGTLQGVEAIPIEVEVDLLRRLPAVSVVGLAAAAVREAAERVRSAIVAAGCEFPRKRVVVNLAPADVRKDGCAFDLAIAIGVLAADGQVPEEALEQVLLVGELSLAGRLRPVRGALALAILARTMGRTLILPDTDAPTAATVPGSSVLGAADLASVVRHLRGEQLLSAPGNARTVVQVSTVDMSEVRGQALARRAVELAAAGAHHCLLMGGPGVGKSLLVGRGSEVMRSSDQRRRRTYVRRMMLICQSGGDRETTRAEWRPDQMASQCRRSARCQRLQRVLPLPCHDGMQIRWLLECLRYASERANRPQI
jgi:magnesium chelatase family protein